jgi:hypothetical protein
MNDRSLPGLLLLTLALFGCQPDDAEDDGACGGDALSFGEAIGGNGFQLVGEGDSFSLAATGGGTIAFRLTSAEDIGSRTVRLYTYYADSAGPGTSELGVPYAQADFPPAQDYGCQLLSTFRVTDAGDYTVHAFLVVGEGNESPVTSSPLHITP